MYEVRRRCRAPGCRPPARPPARERWWPGRRAAGSATFDAVEIQGRRGCVRAGRWMGSRVSSGAYATASRAALCRL